jgi:DNA-binding MarR family transcriptional regulator
MENQVDIGSASMAVTEVAPPVASGRASLIHLEHVLRQIISERRRRTAYFPAALFSDPAWDILLALALAESRQQRVTVTKLCQRIDSPMTTGLRWIAALTGAGLLVRRDDVNDKRRKFVALSPTGIAAIAAYCTAERAPLALVA